MRLLFFFLAIVCFALLLVGLASPIRSQQVDAGGWGYLNFYETKSETLEEASPTLCHVTILVALLTPFLFLVKAHEFVGLASFVLSATVALAFVNNLFVIASPQLGPWQPLSLPWLAMFGACAGYFLLASSATRSEERGKLSLPFQIEWRFWNIIRMILAIGLGIAAIAIAGEFQNALALMSRTANSVTDIMSRHHQDQAVTALCIGTMLSVGAFFAWPKQI